MLVVLACILIPISVISVWAIRTVTNTDQYVETMAPLARNPVIIDGLATRATDALFSTNVVKDKVTEVLPKSAKPLVAPVLSQVKSYVHGLALKVFGSPKFGQLWDALNRHSHDAVINILTGKKTPLQEKFEKGGQIALNLSPALNNLIADANAHGVTLFNPVKSASKGLSFTVVSQKQVSKFSGLFNLIVKAKWVIPIVAFVLAILAMVLAVERRKTLLRLAVGVALMTLVLQVGYSLGRITFLNEAASGGFRTDSAAAVFDTVLRFLKADLRWTLLASVLVAFGAWVAGPARYAVWIRRTTASGARWLAAQAHELSSGAGRAGVRIEPGPPLGRLDPRARQRSAHRRGDCGRAVPGLRREPDGVESAGHFDRAGCVSRAAPAGCAWARKASEAGPVGPGPGGTTGASTTADASVTSGTAS